MANETIEISQRIRKFITENFPLVRKQSTFEDDSPLLDSGIIDSLGVLDLVLFIEEEFKIVVSDEDLLPKNFETIACMAVFVLNKLNGQLSL